MGREKYKHKIAKGKLTKLNSAYSSYLELYGNNVSKKEFIDICRMYNEQVSTLILYGSYQFKIPHFGHLYIKEFEQRLKVDKDGRLETKKLKPNYEATWKLRYSLFPNKSRKEIMELIKGNEDKYRVYHFNEHTDGLIYRWYWDRRTYAIKNLSVYSFRPVKANRRELPKIIKSGLNIKYYAKC